MPFAQAHHGQRKERSIIRAVQLYESKCSFTCPISRRACGVCELAKNILLDICEIFILGAMQP